jgi:hypothetical protein
MPVKGLPTDTEFPHNSLTLVSHWLIAAIAVRSLAAVIL